MIISLLCSIIIIIRGGLATAYPSLIPRFAAAFLVGKGAAFEGAIKITYASLKDGASITLLVAEAAQAVPWTKPEDLAYDPDKDLPNVGGCLTMAFMSSMPILSSNSSRRISNRKRFAR